MSTLKFELLPFIDQRTAEITEAMLVPGSKWLHKMTGEVVGLREEDCVDRWLSLVTDTKVLRGPDDSRIQLRNEMLAWLRAEYVPADATQKTLTVGDLPPGAVFDSKYDKGMYRSDWKSNVKNLEGVACVRLSRAVHFFVDPSTEVTRVHCIMKTTEE